MATTKRSGFVQGLTIGAITTMLVGLAALYSVHPVSSAAPAFPALHHALAWVYANLGLSLPVFALLVGLYVNSLRKLKRALADDASIEHVTQCDQLVNTWANLFFGIGVIWTAIGMRSALVSSLGEPEVTLNVGAYVLLERMVEGGILLALSTTIVGGVGGYVLRVIKTLTVETELKRYYDRLAHAPVRETQATLRAIEAHLKQLTQQTSPRKEINDGQAGVVLPTTQRS